MTYIDGYVLPVAKNQLDAYKALAQKAGAIWMKHGALSYKEAIADDMDAGTQMGAFRDFPKLVETQPGGLVIFAYVIFKSRAHRDEVNAKVMNDAAMKANMEKGDTPFDCKRMVYGGFEAIVDL